MIRVQGQRVEQIRTRRSVTGPHPVLQVANDFGEPGGGPLRIVGYGFVLLAVLALVSFLLVRAGKIKIPARMTGQNAPAASTPSPEKKSEAPVPPVENQAARHNPARLNPARADKLNQKAFRRLRLKRRLNPARPFRNRNLKSPRVLNRRARPLRNNQRLRLRPLRNIRRPEGIRKDSLKSA